MVIDVKIFQLGHTHTTAKVSLQHRPLPDRLPLPLPLEGNRLLPSRYRANKETTPKCTSRFGAFRDENLTVLYAPPF